MSLQRREKALILTAGLILFAAAYGLFLIGPALSHHERLERPLAGKIPDLHSMERLLAEWIAFTEPREQAEPLLASRGDGFSLLSFMEGITRKVGVGDRISYMKPLSFSGEKEGPLTPVGVEIQIDGLGMKELVRLLYEIEYSGKLLRVHRVKIKASSEEEERHLKVTLQVQTYTQDAS